MQLISQYNGKLKLHNAQSGFYIFFFYCILILSQIFTGKTHSNIIAEPILTSKVINV